MKEEIFGSDKKKKYMTFAATNKTIEQNIPKPTESETRGKGGLIRYGESDDYLNFLFQLYLDCPVLSTILNTSTDYVVGDGIVNNAGMQYANKKDETWESLIGKLAFDYLTFGECFIQVIRDNVGRVCEFYHLDARFVRMDEDNEVIYYNKEFGKKYGRSNKMLVYPKFVDNAIDVPTSVIVVKTPFSRGVYGTPIWGSAVKSVMTETKIASFHLNELDNNFTPSAILSFNNGIPSDDEADTLESEVNEKYCGSENGGRLLISFANGKDSAVTVERLGTDDFDKRYDALAKKTQQDIFTSFGANPNLFGCSSDGATGFNSEEYDSSFKIFNRTRIAPIQTRLIDAFDKAFGMKGSLTIKPFSLAQNNEDNVN